jgi:hypothetical protein
MTVTKKKGGRKTMERRPLMLKVRRDIWEKWKILAVREDTTMSEIAERLVNEYLRKKGGA